MRVFEQGSSLKEAREDREYRSIREERMEGFLSSLTDPLESYPELMSIEEACLEKYVPLIRPSMQRFLSFEMKARRPKRILEIGTAVGFSSILMAKNLLEFSDDFHIDTIENYQRNRNRNPTIESSGLFLCLILFNLFISSLLDMVNICLRQQSTLTKNHHVHKTSNQAFLIEHISNL